jgi:hypothetical protein
MFFSGLVPEIASRARRYFLCQRQQFQVSTRVHLPPTCVTMNVPGYPGNKRPAGWQNPPPAIRLTLHFEAERRRAHIKAVCGRNVMKWILRLCGIVGRIAMPRVSDQWLREHERTVRM